MRVLCVGEKGIFCLVLLGKILGSCVFFFSFILFLFFSFLFCSSNRSNGCKMVVRISLLFNLPWGYLGCDEVMNKT